MNSNPEAIPGEIQDISRLSINNLLDQKLCESAGVIPLSVEGNTIKLGAMNPLYGQVTEISEKLKSEFGANVFVDQISIEEWEKWFENSELNNPVSLSSSIEEDTQVQIDVPESNNSNDLEDLNRLEDKNNDFLESLKDKSNFLTPTDDSAADQQINNLFDLIDFEEDDEEEEEETLEAIEDSEFSNSKDPVIKAVGAILLLSQQVGASDIHAEPLEDRMRIRYRVDGVLKEYFTLPKKKSKAIVNRLKVMSKLDIAEKRLPQDGRIRCKLNSIILDFRVSTLPGKWGEKIVLRLLSSDSSMLQLEKLITTSTELDLVREMGGSPYGILIVVGPTGSGKSTTLYSILNERNTPDVNISTVEDPVEYTLPGIHQVQVIREKGLDFSRALRSLMRQDPDIILVGETRDRETAQTAMEAALTGHMVFTTLHANDTATAITRLAEMGIPPYLVGSSVIGVMAQRLVRKVCPACSEVRRVDKSKDILAARYGIEKIRIPRMVDKNKESKINKCSVCNGSGYKGRVGLYEVLKVTESIRELIMKSSTADIIREAASKNGVKNLLGYGMDLVKNQQTTIEEVERVCIQEDVGEDQ